MKTSRELEEAIEKIILEEISRKIIALRRLTRGTAEYLMITLDDGFSREPTNIDVNRQVQYADEGKIVNQPIHRISYSSILDRLGLLDYTYSDIFADPRTGGSPEKVYFLNERARELYEGLKSEGQFKI